MTTGREKRMSIMRQYARKSAVYGPKPKPKTLGLFNDKRWGKDMNTAMSRIKSQASNRKRPITLPKIKLPE